MLGGKMAATSFPPLTLTITLLLLFRFPAVHGNPYPVSALFALGDSSVNCGDNSFLYPFLSSNSSSFRCNSTARRLLIPDLLGRYRRSAFDFEISLSLFFSFSLSLSLSLISLCCFIS